jgi:hypothetical protein
MNRMIRDLRMAGLHMAVTWDERALDFSRGRWGLPSTYRPIVQGP